MKRLIFGLLVVGCFMGLASSRVSAAANANGLTVSPAIQQINLQAKQSSETFSVQVTNNTASRTTLHVGAQDFTALNASGGISFTARNTPFDTAHGLSKAIEPSVTQLMLAPYQSQVVPITIKNANNLAAGGHYTAIVIESVNPNNATGNHVGVLEAVDSLVFVSTYGNGTQAVSLSAPPISKIVTTLPDSLPLVFNNTGNTQTTPNGYVQIFGSHQKLVAQGQLNTNGGLILPDTTRLFNIQLASQLTSGLRPGRYDLQIIYGYQGERAMQTYQTNFIYLPGWLIGGIISLLVLVIVLTFWRWRPKIHYIRRAK